MDQFPNDVRRSLVEIAADLAGDRADVPMFLKRFRIAYQHLAATVDGSTARAMATITSAWPGGFTSYGMPPEFAPKDPEKLRLGAQEILDASDNALSDL